MRRASTILLILALAVGAAGCNDQQWSGKCVGVSDGDTIRVMHRGREEKIRLYGIDSPERGQDFGERARQFTADMVFGKTVTVRTVDKDQYGRTVAWVTVDGKNLNEELVKAGLAWWYRAHAANEKELKRLEQQARKARIGLWSMKDPVPPWKFRHSEKKEH